MTVDSKSTDKLAIVMDEIEKIRGDSEISQRVKEISLTWEYIGGSYCRESGRTEGGLTVPILNIKFSS